MLKLSGEAFAGDRGAGGGLDFSVVDRLADELKTVAALGVQLGLVVGGCSADPKQDPKAKFLAELSFRDALVNGYAVMDANAFGLCKENNLPIVVFNINQPGATARVLAGERVGTIVR